MVWDVAARAHRFGWAAAWHLTGASPATRSLARSLPGHCSPALCCCLPALPLSSAKSALGYAALTVTLVVVVASGWVARPIPMTITTSLAEVAMVTIAICLRLLVVVGALEFVLSTSFYS